MAEKGKNDREVDLKSKQNKVWGETKEITDQEKAVVQEISTKQGAENLPKVEKKEDVKKVVNLLPEIEVTRLFIVSNAKETNNLDAKEYTVAKVLVNTHTGVRCERCWNRFEANLLNSLNICPRCEKAMKKVGF